MKRIIPVLILLSFLAIAGPVRADYVLPYPSYMPGNKFYRVSRLLDKLENYWYWGNIAQVKYHLKLSDKYLVEAKTLFEYKQYLLGINALIRSDREFKFIPADLIKAAYEGKDISKLEQLVKDAATEHIKVLTKLESEIPKKFVWMPEKQKSQELNLSESFIKSINIRESLLK